MALSTSSQNILDAVDKAMTAKRAYDSAIYQSSLEREAAMRNLGVELTTGSGSVLTPQEAATRLGPAGQGFEGVTASVGFGEGAIPTITKEQVGAVADVVAANTERGVGESGLTEQQRKIIGEQGAIDTTKTIAEARDVITASEAEVVNKKGDLDLARADVKAARGIKASPRTGPKAETKAEAAKRRASARAAANQKAKAAGKPLPYGAGGAPNPKPTPGVKPPSPAQKKKGKK